MPKPVADGRCQVDVLDLYRRRKLLGEDRWVLRMWPQVPGHKHQVDFAWHGDHVLITYRLRRQGEERWITATEWVALEWTPCTFGGSRPWFLCPRCGLRVRKLYRCRGFFICRHCGGLGYQSQREDAPWRAARKARKIRRRLGGSPNLCVPFPDKPPRMRWATYFRLEQQHAECMRAVMAEVRATLERGEAVLRRLDARRAKRDGRGRADRAGRPPGAAGDASGSAAR